MTAELLKLQHFSRCRYGNASTTIRDDVLFKNAGEWLKKTLLDSYPHFAQAKRLEKAKATDSQEEKENELNPPSTNVPLVTVGSSHDGASESQYTEGVSEVTSTIKEAAALSGLLFEPDPYGKHSRPPSSVLSKLSATSTVVIARYILSFRVLLLKYEFWFCSKGESHHPYIPRRCRNYQRQVRCVWIPPLVEATFWSRERYVEAPFEM